MTVKKSVRKSAGQLLLMQWVQADVIRTSIWSNARREMREGYTDEEIRYLMKQTDTIKEAQERIRKLAWRLQKSA